MTSGEISHCLVFHAGQVDPGTAIGSANTMAAHYPQCSVCCHQQSRRNCSADSIQAGRDVADGGAIQSVSY